jgi:hypothetical protein
MVSHSPQEAVRVCGRDVPLEPLLALADVVVTLTSTVGLQASLLGKPVVAVRLSVFEEESPLRLLPRVIGVDDLVALIPSVSKVLTTAAAAAHGQDPRALGRSELSAAAAVTRVLDQMLRLC